LIWQWQDEMKNLLDMPSAVWNGRQWVDENGIDYPAVTPGHFILVDFVGQQFLSKARGQRLELS
jgi:hypothetical protein